VVYLSNWRPSGRLTEREYMPSKVASKNISKITHQLQSLFFSAKMYAASHGYDENSFGKVEVLNNESWWKDFSFSEFLTQVARFMRLGPMLARERYNFMVRCSNLSSVKARLQSPEGVDAASFLYQLLQAYDFLRLYQTKRCQLQVHWFYSVSYIHR
jgi:tyrosyl-tRNA synthetase